MKTIITAVSIVAVIILGYFFSSQFQKFFGKIMAFISKKVGTFSKNRDFAIQRYVFLHRNSPVSRFYNWVNVLLIATGLKRSGVTPVGYLIYWFIASGIISIALMLLAKISILSMLGITVLLFIFSLVITRTVVAEKIEKREMEVMDAVDLIIPEIHEGVKNAITRYLDNFPASLQSDFRAFVANIQDRGYSFEDAMYILADSLGPVFKDFAQKAVFYEKLGEPDMVDIFTDILETNRNRRQLRYENNMKFAQNKTSFIASTAIVTAYFIFILATDTFSYNFFIRTTPGHISLVVIVSIIVGVLAYITTIKSREL